MADLPIRHEDLYHGIAVPQETWFRRSYFHTPSELAHELFLTALRAGEVRAASDYRAERRVCGGQDLLYCTRGRGFVLVGGRTFPVHGGQLAWIDGHRPHAHWPIR